MTRTIRIPGPDHPITIDRNPRRVVVTLGDKVIADTTEALTLRQASYPAVQYIPRKDVDMAALVRSDTVSYCPYKGEAAYFSILGRGEWRATTTMSASASTRLSGDAIIQYDRDNIRRPVAGSSTALCGLSN